LPSGANSDGKLSPETVPAFLTPMPANLRPPQKLGKGEAARTS